ncbi:hypothetical protein D777_00549 [Marinobacter nitratireducens]|uniref:Uncharacterized protein n=1 Tax=Marinobacter nitratireducens TaxID=1137280 RepID=A0A072N6V2_9GAMM|nr:DUF6586 family protein [Marinobacter nitratireducens]KEF32987.1 hypothetical protein D777_00549 [Marinobacter nitratireducens]
MASQWHSQVSQKLFMARTLLKQAQNVPSAEPEAQAPGTDQALLREAAIQGATELMIRARRLLLNLIAQLYQHRSAEPATLAELAGLIGEETNEVRQLRELERQAGSWWNHLEQLETAQSRPAEPRKTVSADNIIAISAETGPDRSGTALLNTVGAMKIFADDLAEQHSEW